ncbi:hypothetical protein AXE75_02510 [Gardnerella vaginalis]|uniref:restriction endonuclease subunit S n=1 Tax=Gardnerella vaginalis TaxID=2702 RepID=UPI000E31F4F1|nr:restriction endonuclease subunit S [Gardnerella vaginalis]RFD76207.1 hypothetical protein AXE75_02510 [Gardnerella vaginalis]
MRKAYEEYKETGIQWLPKIPRHWDWSFLSQIAAEKKVKKTKNEMFPVMSLSYGQIIKKKNINSGLVPNNYDNYQIISRGDIVLRFTDLQNDHTSLRTGLVTEKGIITSAYTNIKPRINSSFLAYLLHAYDNLKIFYGLGGGVRQSIGFKDVRYLQLPIPPREEQEQIVRFLDWKVSSINKLIIDYRHQITMLEELKQKKIDKYVIKGIHKNNTKHNDDVRWEIDYPEHWTIQRISQCFSFRKGLSITKANLEETGIAVINYGQIHSKNNKGIGLNKSLIKHVNKSYLKTNQRCLVERGDFIFADTSEDVAGCGNCAYIDWDDNIFAGYHTIIAHPNRSANSKYLAYLFSSPTWRCQIRKNVNGVKVYSITQRILKDMFILIPPIEEQKDIVNHLDSMCSEIDFIVKMVDKKITNLHDLKSSLIADVVTGKIDVRDVEIPNYKQVAESLHEADDNATLHSEDEIPEEV